MATAHPKNRRFPSRLVFLLLLAAALLTASAVGGWLYANREFVRFTPFEQDAAELLEQLITDSRLSISQTGAVEQLADGAEMDAALRTFITSANANTVRAAFQQSCQRAGLSAPDAMTSGWEPDALCAGAWRSGTATVGVQLRCTTSCRVKVTVYHAWF